MSNTRRAVGIISVVLGVGGLAGLGLWLAGGWLTTNPMVGVLSATAIAGVTTGLLWLLHTLSVRQDPRTTALLKLTQTLNTLPATAELKASARALAQVLAETWGLQRGGWLVFTPETNGWHVQVVAGLGQWPEPVVNLSRTMPLFTLSETHRAPFSAAAVRAHAAYATLPSLERDWFDQLTAEWYVPVFENSLLVALWLSTAPTRPLTPHDLTTLHDLTLLAAVHLQAARARAEVRAQQTTLTSLHAEVQTSNQTVAQMDASRSDFLAIASHELRTPITQLLGFADLLKEIAHDDPVDSATVSEVSTSIVRACTRLNEVVSQILDMAQLDVNALELHIAPVSLENVLRRAIEPFAPALRERRLTLTVRGLHGLPTLQADEERLVQAFWQLMSNAIKFTPDGGKIDISARVLAETRTLEVVVADSGIGIDPSYHQLIFEKFYRVGSASQHSTSTTRFMGAGPGLGLPIARGVIERHGGQLWVESPGCDPATCPGTRMMVRLPLRLAAFTAENVTKKEITQVKQSPFVGM